MDITDLMENLEALFPILIFAIWVIITVLRHLVGGKEKEEVSGDSASRRERRVAGSPSDELRRSLEGIFGLPEEGESLENPQELLQKSRAPGEKPLETAYEEMLKKEERKPGAPSESLAPVDTEESRISEKMILNRSELRKGIIWHELLQPPLALREETRSVL